jgi:GT2 family glycosyltransferase
LDISNCKVAVLITCHNRRPQTLNCLENIYNIIPNVNVFLVDDKSTDGTPDLVSERFPNVFLLHGNGNLFWNRGMYMAWVRAAKNDYDFYIWVNDDVQIFSNCFTELFECSKMNMHKAIISGIIKANDSVDIIYGGYDQKKMLFQPNGKLNRIFSMNGNVVLVPKYVYNILGNLDPLLHHDLGDIDYGLRAQKKGIGVFTTRIIVGTGQRNNICRVRKNNTILIKRFKYLYTPLGANPFINFYFRKKHYGIFNAIFYFIFLHFLNLIPDILNKILFKDKYI